MNSGEITRRASRRGRRARSVPKGDIDFHGGGGVIDEDVFFTRSRPVGLEPPPMVEMDSFISHRQRPINFGAVLPTKPYSSELLRCYRDDRDFQPSNLGQLKTSATAWFDVPYRTKDSGIGKRNSWRRSSSHASNGRMAAITRV